jgi:K+-transporting ATPase KdpF subunit
MNVFYYAAGAVAATALLIYLFLALLKPESLQ